MPVAQASYHHRRSGCFLLFLFAVIFIASLIDAAPALAASLNQSSDKQTAPTDGPSVTVNGYFNARYMFRSAETASGDIARDQDVYGELRIDLTAPKSGTYEFHFMGNVRSDLDGHRDIHTYYPLEDIGDTGQQSTMGNVYEAHLDLNDPFPRVTQIRLGRQAGTRDEQVFFDGIALEVRPVPKINLTVYGGAAVHFYEISRSEGDDSLAGVGIDLYPTSLTGMSLDYLTVKDARNYLTLTDVRNDLVSLKLWQRFGENVKATAKARYQDSDFRDASLRLLGSFPQ